MATSSKIDGNKNRLQVCLSNSAAATFLSLLTLSLANLCIRKTILRIITVALSGEKIKRALSERARERASEPALFYLHQQREKETND
jgi:hypothetical protein